MSEVSPDPLVDSVEVDDPPPVPKGPSLAARLNYYIGRVVVVLTAAAAAGTSLMLVVADADLTTVGGAAIAFVAVVPVLLKFLEGVQQHEKAGYQLDLQVHQAESQLRIIAAEEQAAGAIGGARGTARIATPGR